MRLHYYASVPNFGDDLNRWLWTELFGGALPVHPRVRLLGIGTVIDRNVPGDRQVVVLGSGVGYQKVPSLETRAKWRFLGVRGPLTASILGLPPSAVLTDSALLLRALPCGSPLPDCKRDGGVVFMPHHRSDDVGLWPEVCRRAGVLYLSPYGDSRQKLEALRRSRLVLADAMHAAIVADAVRVPWIPIVTSCEVSSFKWVDWTLSMKLDYRPLHIHAHNLRSWWREGVLDALKQGLFSAPFDTGSQLERWRERLSAPSCPAEGLRKALALKACGKRWMRWIGRLEGGGLFRRQEERMIEAAAGTLRAAARRDGFLSEESRQIEKLEELRLAAGSIARGAG
jgi:succinoglycan biosynthesis protein ExoV